MSEENVEVVRQRLAVRASLRRRLAERLVLRFPAAANRISRGVLRRPPDSLVRRTAVRYFLRIALEAVNRGDYEAAFAVLFFSEYEAVTPSEAVVLGFDQTYIGREGRLRFQREWGEELGEFQQKARELIDCGDRFLLLGHMEGTGLGSGATFDSEVAYLFTVSDGQLIREQIFRSHAEALEAAGLSE